MVNPNGNLTGVIPQRTVNQLNNSASAITGLNDAPQTGPTGFIANDRGDGSVSGPDNTNLYLYLGIGAVALYLLTR